jgi:hypothetical protein
LDREAKILRLEAVFSNTNITVVKPTAISAPVEFRVADGTYLLESDFADVEAKILEFVRSYSPEGAPTRVFEWQQERTVNFGFLSQQGGIVENYYISIEVG